MIAICAFVLMFTSSQAKAELVSWDLKSGDLAAVQWATVDFAHSRTSSVAIKHPEQYQVQFTNWAFCLADNDQMAVIYAERKDKKELLIVRRSGSVGEVPVKSEVRFLEFINHGSGLVASFARDTSSQVFSTGPGLPPLSPRVEGQVRVGSDDAFLAINGFNMLKIPSSKNDKVILRNASRFEALIKSVLNYHKKDPYGVALFALWSGSSSPDSRFWIHTRLREFIVEGKHDADKFFGANGLFSVNGLEWQWKTGMDDLSPFNYDPPCYVNPTKIAFLVRQRFIMGRPGDPKFYPPGLYTLDLKTWKPTRQPLSSRLLNKKYENYHLVSYHL